MLQHADASLRNFSNHCAVFRLPSRPVIYVQLAEKEILIVVASLTVHCCAVKKYVIVASYLYDLANLQCTIE